MSMIRGVLLAGNFRTHAELNTMSREDRRNTLIVVLTSLSNQTNYQSFDDATLEGMGAVLVFLRKGRIRTDAELKLMSADDQRNTMIVEMGSQTGLGRELQGLTNMQLVKVGLGSDLAVRGSQPGVVSSFLRGILLSGSVRSQRELNAMTPEDHRNTLIVVLTSLSNQNNYQSFNNAQLEEMGAVLMFLRESKICDDSTLKRMSAEDQRNTLIVAIAAQTRLGAQVQGLSRAELVLVGCGDNEGVVGESDGIHAVFGRSHSRFAGVLGTNDAGGIGVHGKGGRLAGLFEGDVEVTGDIRLTNADCAEDFTVSSACAADPGTVMVFGEEDILHESCRAYDTRVAGVVSGAGRYKPAIVLDRQPQLTNRKPIALMGKVGCKVDAGFGAIQVGDLLTTSPTAGHAMKATDPTRAFGAVIGKALQSVPGGRSIISILVCLQ